MPSPEWKKRATEREVVRGRDHLGLDRPGPGVGDAGLDGGLHGDARQRRHARHAALLKAVDEGNGLEAVPAPPPQSKVELITREDSGDSRRAVARRQRRRHGRPRADHGLRRVGQDRNRAGHLARGRPAAKGKTTRDLRDHGWFVFFAPRDNPQIAGVVFAEHGEHGANAAPIAKHVLETFFAKKEGGRCRRRCRCRASRRRLRPAAMIRRRRRRHAGARADAPRDTGTN